MPTAPDEDDASARMSERPKVKAAGSRARPRKGAGCGYSMRAEERHADGATDEAVPEIAENIDRRDEKIAPTAKSARGRSSDVENPVMSDRPSPIRHTACPCDPLRICRQQLKAEGSEASDVLAGRYSLGSAHPRWR